LTVDKLLEQLIFPFFLERFIFPFCGDEKELLITQSVGDTRENTIFYMKLYFEKKYETYEN